MLQSGKEIQPVEGNLDVWVRQVAGGEPLRITRDGSNNTEPVFSADNSHIAFRSEREGGGIYTVSALGGEEHQLKRLLVVPTGTKVGVTANVTTGK